MANKTERIVINIVGNEVGVHYEPATSEATLADHLAADELALHALCQQCVGLRRQHGLPVPPALTTLIQSETYRELM
jgi:hypothetical protein